MKKAVFVKIIASALALMLGTALLTSCEKKETGGENEVKEPEEKYVYDDGFTVKNLADNGYNITTVNVEIEGLDREYHYIIGADLHVIVDSDEVAADQKATVKNRIKMFTAANGVTSAKQWETLPGLLNECGADALFFNADMIDYNSQANVDAFGEGLSKLTTPYYYMRADHDSKPSYLADTDKKKASDRQKNLCPNDELFIIEYDSFMIVGVNNALTNTTKKKLEQVNELFAKGKPIILISHPPFDSLVDTSLADAVWARENGNSMLSKNTTYKYFDQNMFKYIETVTSEESPVIEILAGHQHFDWDGMVTEKTHEHVFGTLAGYNIGVLNVVPAK